MPCSTCPPTGTRPPRAPTERTRPEAFSTTCTPGPVGRSAWKASVNRTMSSASRQVTSCQGSSLGVLPGRPQSRTVPGTRLTPWIRYVALPARAVTVLVRSAIRTLWPPSSMSSAEREPAAIDSNSPA